MACKLRSYTCFKGSSLSKVLISALSDLQHLDVSHTNLAALPQEVGTLGELRFLFSWTPRLRAVPGGAISSLRRLRALHMYSSYADWETTGGGAGFDELKSLWRLRSLDLTLQTVEALRRLAASAQLGASTRRLHLSRCQGLGGIRLPAGALWANMNALQWLRISSCANLENVTVSVDGSGSAGARRASLPSLQELVLHRLPKVKVVVWRGDLPFTSLRRLYVWSCTGIEALVARDDPAASGATATAAFPNVTHLQLVNLPELKSLVPGGDASLALPALEVLEVRRCPKLSSLSVAKPKAVAVVRCDAEWWAGLDWTDEAAKTSFKPVFI